MRARKKNEGESVTCRPIEKSEVGLCMLMILNLIGTPRGWRLVNITHWLLQHVNYYLSVSVNILVITRGGAIITYWLYLVVVLS